MEALKLQPRQFNFTHYDEVLAEIRKIYNEDYNFDDFCNLRDWIIENEETIHTWLNKFTLAKLKDRIRLSDGGNKPEYIAGGYRILLYKFDIVEVEYKMVIVEYDAIHAPKPAPSTEQQSKYHKLIARVNEVTPGDYHKKRDKVLEERKALKKAIDNPETLKEFKICIQFRKLSSPELEAYDKLAADERREERQRQNREYKTIGGVELGDAKMQIVPSFHTKYKKDIWMVRLDQFVRLSLFIRLCEKSHALDGYYSDYDRDGAIPGFLFWTPEAADKFTQLAEGDVDISDMYEDMLVQQLENRIQSLRQKAANLIEMGETEYSRERKTNTHRRVLMANNAEAKAVRKIAMGKILDAIANGQEDGTVDYLENLSFISDLETLNIILYRAKRKMMDEKKIPYADRDAVPLTTEWADYVEIPYPVLDIESSKSALLRCKDEPGKINAVKLLVKKFKEAIAEKNTTYVCQSERTIDAFNRIYVTDSSYCQFYDQLRIYNRIVRLNLLSIHELRAAIRELIRFKLGTSLTPEQKLIQMLRDLERSFVGRNIKGFFPTPRPLALSVIEKADIETGHRILEPSAGLGHLADVIAELHPGNELQTIEIHPGLADALRIKGHSIEQGDFLENNPDEPQYDRIIMNPPFEDQQDNEHVMHAFNNHLKIGGRLVAIMANNKTNTRNTYFLDWVKSIGGTIEENPAGSFASAFRPTGVSTVTVILDK